MRISREPAADLIPRFDGASLRFTSKASLRGGPVERGAVAGPVLLDLGDEGRLIGVTVLEARRFWQKGTIAWPLPGRATPHRLDLVGTTPAEVSEVRWDAGRRLCGVLFGEAVAPEVVALGPRAYAAVADDVLVGLLADLRGFDRA